MIGDNLKFYNKKNFTGTLYHVTTMDRAENILNNGFDLEANIRTSLHNFGRGVFLGGEFNDWLRFFEFAKIFHDILDFNTPPKKDEINVVIECFVKNAYLYNHYKEEKIIFATELYDKIRNNFDGICSMYESSLNNEYCIWNLDKIQILGLKEGINV